MLIFVVVYWYVFLWYDFVDNSILLVCMFIQYVLCDFFGIWDFIEDFKEIFCGDNYGYCVFDLGDKVMVYEDFKLCFVRFRDGMCYE